MGAGIRDGRKFDRLARRAVAADSAGLRRTRPASQGQSQRGKRGASSGSPASRCGTWRNGRDRGPAGGVGGIGQRHLARMGGQRHRQPPRGGAVTPNIRSPRPRGSRHTAMPGVKDGIGCSATDHRAKASGRPAKTTTTRGRPSPPARRSAGAAGRQVRDSRDEDRRHVPWPRPPPTDHIGGKRHRDRLGDQIGFGRGRGSR